VALLGAIEGLIDDAPLTAERDALLVTWLELTITNATTGEQLYGLSNGHFHNAWEVARCGAMTNHVVTRDTVQSMAQAGRTRWKAENENHMAPQRATYVLKAPRPVMASRTATCGRSRGHRGAERGYHVDHNFGQGGPPKVALRATVFFVKG